MGNLYFFLTEDCKYVWNGSRLQFSEFCYSTTATIVPCTNKWTENNDTLEWFEKVIGCLEANTKLLPYYYCDYNNFKHAKCVWEKKFRRYCVRVYLFAPSCNHTPLALKTNCVPIGTWLAHANKNSPWLYDLQFCSFFLFSSFRRWAVCRCVWVCVCVWEWVRERESIWNDWKDEK